MGRKQGGKEWMKKVEVIIEETEWRKKSRKKKKITKDIAIEDNATQVGPSEYVRKKGKRSVIKMSPAAEIILNPFQGSDNSWLRGICRPAAEVVRRPRLHDQL